MSTPITDAEKNQLLFGNGSYQIISPPPTVGFYLLDPYVKFGAIKKPNWFHRKTIKWVLGWKWEDVK